MSVRAATGDDLAAIMAIERASFAGDAWSEAAMAADIASPHNFYVVTERAGRIVGYAGLRAPAGSKDADIQTIALDEAARGGGRGRTLLTTLLAEADRRGLREVFLDVRADNPVAQSLYVSEGFVEIGRRPNYYPDGPTDAIVMRLDVPGWRHARSPGAPGATPDSDDSTGFGSAGPQHPNPSSAPGSVNGAWCT